MSDFSELIKFVITGFTVFRNVCYDNDKLNHKTSSTIQVLYYDHFPTGSFLRLHRAAQIFTLASAIFLLPFLHPVA